MVTQVHHDHASLHGGPRGELEVSNSAKASDEECLLADESEETVDNQILPPIDGGAGAWTFLLGIWLIEAMLWGFPLAFGIFQSHYSQHNLFKDDSSIPAIAALAIGISYLGVPFVNPIAFRFARYQRYIIFFGWSLCILGLVAASFATKVWHLLLTQGVMYGAGWVICYTPFLIMLNDWFVKKRGLAIGILFGASGVSGMVLPFILEALLNRHGFRVTLRVYAVAMVVISGPGLFMLKPRVTSQDTSTRPRADTFFLSNGHFYFFAGAILFQGLGFFLPNTFLPSFANALGLSKTHGDLLLALTSLAQVTGQMVMGHVSDNMNAYIPTTISTLIQALAVLLLWGPAKDFWRVALFALAWGFSAGSYSVLYTSAATTLTASAGEMMTLYSFFSFERGIANVLEGPIAALLLGTKDDMTRYGLGKYQKIVWFVGVMMLLSSIGGIGYFMQDPRASGRRAKRAVSRGHDHEEESPQHDLTRSLSIDSISTSNSSHLP